MEFINFIYWLQGWTEISNKREISSKEAYVVLEHIEKVLSDDPSQKIVLFMLKTQLKKFVERYEELCKTCIVTQITTDEWCFDLIKEIIGQYINYKPAIAIKIKHNPINQDIITNILNNREANFSNKKLC